MIKLTIPSSSARSRTGEPYIIHRIPDSRREIRDDQLQNWRLLMKFRCQNITLPTEDSPHCSHVSKNNPNRPVEGTLSFPCRTFRLICLQPNETQQPVCSSGEYISFIFLTICRGCIDTDFQNKHFSTGFTQRASSCKSGET